MAPPNPFDYFAIQNTISRYCIALDTKDFKLLEQVFHPEVDASYPFNTGLKGVSAVAAAIQKRLTHITSQHALTTQVIEVSEDGKTATAVTYFTGIHFGKGSWDGKEVTAWGKYFDTLTVTEGPSGVPGSSGKWLISEREVIILGRLGEERVMEGE